jgi:type I restriction enzyme S subunit
VAEVNPRTQKDDLDDNTLASFVPMKCVEAESGRFAPPENKKVGEVKKGYTPMRDGDVIFAKVTPCMENGKAAVVRGLTNGIGFGSTEFYALRPKDNLVSEFLFYYIIQQGFRREAERHMTGAVGLRRVPKIFIEEHDIPLPPLSEQRRIVARIEELFSRLDAGVAALRQAKAQLQRYRQSVLAAAVTGQLTQAWREQHPDTEPAELLLKRTLKEHRESWNGSGKYKEPDPLEDTPSGSIPESWAWASIAQIGFVQLGRQRSPKNRSKDYPTKYIRAANITEDGLALEDLLEMEFSPSEQTRFRLKFGDIILSEASGSPDQVGKPAIWKDEVENCCFQNTVIRLRATGFDNEFLLIVLKHFHRNKVFANIAGGVGINHLSAAKFSKMSTAVPPLAEQHQIVAEVEARTTAIAHLEAELDRQITRSNRLRQSTLKSAFNGSLS